MERLLEKDSEGNYINQSGDPGDESDGYEDDLEEKLVTEARNRFLKALQVKNKLHFAHKKL